MQLYPNSMSRVASDGIRTGKVGIIMRTQNRPILLSRALASVLHQKYSDWHLYIVNDGGTIPELEAVIDPVRTSFGRRLTTIHHGTAKGMESASNAGMSKALDNECEFLCIHDDDDAWDPDFLKETVAFLQDEKNRGFAAVVTEKVIIRERIEGEYVIEEGVEPGFVPPRITFGNLCEANQFPPICLLFRSKVACTLGNFNSALPVLGDWDYHLRILVEGDIGVIPKKLAYYHHRRQSSDSYGNTVTAGVQKHEAYGARFINSITRQLVQENPGYIGLLHILLKNQAELYIKTRDKLDYYERALQDLRPIIQDQNKKVTDLTQKIDTLLTTQPWWKFWKQGN
jgi:glycosyltransferase involved in cell wall biosynthesis